MEKRKDAGSTLRGRRKAGRRSGLSPERVRELKKIIKELSKLKKETPHGSFLNAISDKYPEESLQSLRELWSAHKTLQDALPEALLELGHKKTVLLSRVPDPKKAWIDGLPPVKGGKRRPITEVSARELRDFVLAKRPKDRQLIPGRRYVWPDDVIKLSENLVRAWPRLRMESESPAKVPVNRKKELVALKDLLNDVTSQIGNTLSSKATAPRTVKKSSAVKKSPAAKKVPVRKKVKSARKARRR